MHEAAPHTLVERARDAAARSDWQQAHALLLEADASAPLARSELPLLADVAYAAGHLDVTIEAWERAHAEAAKAGDNLTAALAAVRVAKHVLFDTALLAPVRGWLKRAERLLEGLAETPVHAWLAVVRNYERLLSGDFEAARHWARHAIELGTRHDPAAAAMGRLAEARSIILMGDVSNGLSLLNEAAVATVSGELDPLSTGVVYCELVCASQALAQYDLAEEWTEAMERWRHGQAVGSIHGRCRVHRAEIFRLRGAFAEAEQEALLACDELRPYLRRELGWPLCELGRIRLRRGDIAGAEEAFLAAHQVGWDPQPGLAMVQLARGEVALAVVSVREALDHPSNIPSKEWPPNTELRRAPLLEAQVEIELAAGDLGRAESAANELASVAALFQSKALAAAAALAAGRVQLARRDIAGARRQFEAALHDYSDINAPYETALARVGLAQAYRADCSEARALLELRAAQSTFERIGAVREAAQAALDCRAAGANESNGPAVPPQPHLATALGDATIFQREGDYWLVAFGATSARLRDSKGMRYLARILADPGRQFHALDLVALERGVADTDSHPAELGAKVADRGGVSELLDARAKEGYRRRLIEIEEDIEEARALSDLVRAAQAEAERDFIVRELASAVGLGGRDRRVGSASERARSAVTRAIRQAMTRIVAHNPALGQHLDRVVRTGTYCAYLPDPRAQVAWKL